MRSFEKAKDIKYKGIFFFSAPYVTQATNHLENYHMNTENPAWDIWVYFCKCCFKCLFPYATTYRALVQTADDDVRILFVGNVTAIKKLYYIPFEKVIDIVFYTGNMPSQQKYVSV